jgi:MHS family alpha-ketoglutarate permease-like MFS transporter
VKIAPRREGGSARAVIIGSLGNLVEWYDFYAYAAFALYFASSFFPEGTEVAQQLSAALVFALGFIVRPIGGWLFGTMADRVGRRAALTSSVLLMCFGSLVIAVTPTFAAIGSAAPVVLVFARLLQGLSLGGEYGASATYLAEIAPSRRRGLSSSFQPVTIIGGQLLALAVLIVLQRVLGPRGLSSWGWRVPFFLGALFALVAAVMRRGLRETTAFEHLRGRAETKESTLRALLRHPREVAIVVGLSVGGTAAFYTCTTYMQKFLRLSTGLTEAQTSWVTAGSLAFAMLLQPLYGMLSDRIGRKWLLVGFGVLGTTTFVPLLVALEQARDPFVALLLLCFAWLVVSGYTSVNVVVKAELFPAGVRATGVGLPFAVTVSLFGGTAEPIALALKHAGHERVFYYYLAACIAVSLVVYVAMRDTKAHSAMQGD